MKVNTNTTLTANTTSCPSGNREQTLWATGGSSQTNYGAAGGYWYGSTDAAESGTSIWHLYLVFRMVNSTTYI